MARVGRFARRRGNSTNLTSLIAQLVREQNAARDRNIFDAYKNGGLFEGQPVTDERLLAYIKTRRDGFSKDDPLWDQWNNTLIQNNFSIGEQKIALAYKQGKVGESAVAAFYNGQLASIPKDSAFYREVAGRAAEWAKAARENGAARARASSAQSAAKAAASAGDAAQLAGDTYFTAEAAIRTELAREGYALPDSQSIYNVGFDVINNIFESGGVTVNGTPLTLANFERLAQGYSNALETQASAYKAAGRDFISIAERKRDFDATVVTQIASIPIGDRAETVYRNLDASLIAANGDPIATQNAYDQARKAVEALYGAASADKNADPEMLGALQNDLTALSGGTPNGPGLIDEISRANVATGGQPFVSITPGQGEDAKFGVSILAQDVAANVPDAQDVLAGKKVLVQDKPGSAFSVITVAGADSLNEQYQRTVVSSGGVLVPTYVQGTPVYGTTFTDFSGAPIARRATAADSISAPQTLLGYKFDTTVGGRTTTVWGIRDASGILRYTQQNPFLGETTPEKDKIVVSPSQAMIDAGQTGDGAFFSRDALATASNVLFADPQAVDLIRRNPSKYYGLVANGVLGNEAYIEATLGPRMLKATSGTQAGQIVSSFYSDVNTASEALVIAQSRNRQPVFDENIQQPIKTGSPIDANYQSEKSTLRGMLDRVAGTPRVSPTSGYGSPGFELPPQDISFIKPDWQSITQPFASTSVGGGLSFKPASATDLNAPTTSSLLINGPNSQPVAAVADMSVLNQPKSYAAPTQDFGGTKVYRPASKGATEY